MDGDRMGAVRGRAAGSLASLFVFVAILLLLHLVDMQRDRSPWYLSHYAAGDLFWWWTLGLLALAASVWLLAGSLPALLPASPLRPVGVVLLQGIVGGLGLMAAFHADQWDPDGLSSRIHLVAASATFLMVGVTTFLFGTWFGAAEGWRDLAGASKAAGACILFGLPLLLVLHLAGDHGVAVVQRVIVAVAVTWLGVVGHRIWRRTGTPAGWSVRAPSLRSTQGHATDRNG